MMIRRGYCALLLAGMALLGFGLDAHASGRRVYVAPYTWNYYLVGPGYTPYANYYYSPYSPYVAPWPAYGILPPPVYQYDWRYDAPRATVDPLEYPARKRASAYPAIPFEKSVAVETVDRLRVRFEITVSTADAIVSFDGVPTKQTGLTRVFVTPPLQEGKEYTITIDARWPTDEPSAAQRRTFTVAPGQTIQHTFILK